MGRGRNQKGSDIGARASRAAFLLVPGLVVSLPDSIDIPFPPAVLPPFERKVFRQRWRKPAVSIVSYLRYTYNRLLCRRIRLSLLLVVDTRR